MKYQENRTFMKSKFHLEKPQKSDRKSGAPQPDFIKPFPKEKQKIDLPGGNQMARSRKTLAEMVEERKSRRVYSQAPLTLEELSYLLAMTQKISGRGPSFRAVPSGGSRHPYETYLAVQRVDGLEEGIYRYNPFAHQLIFLESKKHLQKELEDVACRQIFLARGAVVFLWACIPYRGEWRYMEDSHKSMLLDAGHIGQALYMAAESVELAVCTVAGYHQENADKLLRIDGEEEFVVYMAAVGKRK